MENINEITVGIIGGGQLGKMTILEGKKMGIKFIVLDPNVDCPAASIADELIVADFYDAGKLEELALKSNVITYEFEHINSDILMQLVAKGHQIFPSPRTLSIIQDKLHQKELLRINGIPVPEFEKVDSIEELKRVVEKMGYPLLLKKRRGGYDGKGNYLIQEENDLMRAYDDLGGDQGLLMVEKYIPFHKEVSVISARGINNEIVLYPLAENNHQDNILRQTIVPAGVNSTVEDKAKEISNKAMQTLEGAGIFCVEMFVLENGSVLVNEIAPRTHNSGHFTIEGCYTSQFQQHLRSILGYPLGDTSLIKPCIMVNLLGEKGYYGKGKLIGGIDALKLPGVYLHYYGKAETRPQRKMGHVNILGETPQDALWKAELVKNSIKIIGYSKEETYGY